MNTRRITIVGVLCVVVALQTVATSGAARAAVPGPVATAGYVHMADGVKLRYALLRPRTPGRHPVAVNYGPYYEGSDAAQSPQTLGLVAAGYAVVGINTRGTGCSTGLFKPFTRQDALDGAAMVEWAAAQPWSTGHVGLFGMSAGAILQYGIAGLRPPHLDAIAPFQPAVDLFRDAVYPGGILDAGFAALWGLGLQPEMSDKAAAKAISQGDTACISTAAAHQSDPGRAVLFRDVLGHTFDDEVYRSRNPKEYLARVKTPVLGCLSWQDDAVSSRSFYSFDTLIRETTWMVGTNGFHDVCDSPNVQPYLHRFFDHFLKGAANGFEATPHVTILHDAHGTTADNAARLAGTRDPTSAAGWVTTHPTWPVAVKATELYLHDAGILNRRPARAGDTTDTFLAPLPSAPAEDGYLGQTHTGWKLNDAPSGSVTYTSPRLARDAEVFGPASVDLWISSSAVDADVQVTLSELRPDGHEVYVQRGWLRASHRALDAGLSTALRPYQTHRAADEQPLVPGQPTKLRVEVFPFGYVFRHGSSIRLTVDTPLNTGLWIFGTDAKPKRVTVLHDAAHASRVVLGLVPGGRALAPAQPCNTLLNQPCRRNRTAAPAGEIDLG